MVPEVKNWVAGHAVSADDLKLRLEQLYGIPPDRSNTQFIDLWVNTGDLFRPSPDPEITDYEAEPDFPTSPYFTIDADYRGWFNNRKDTIYTADPPWPWTRLGYTYDWGNPNSEVGLSEFVIRAGAFAEINAMTDTADYFTLPSVVLDLGADAAAPGDRITVSGCIPATDNQMIDIYLVLVSTSGDVLSVCHGGCVAEGMQTYYSAVSGLTSRTCATLLNYTVRAGLTQGEWTACLAVLPAGARAVLRNAIAYYSGTITIEAR